MADRDSFFQNAASAADDELMATVSDHIFQYSGGHRRADTGMNEPQSLVLMVDLIEMMRAIFPLMRSYYFGLLFADNFFNRFSEETDDAMFWNITRLENVRRFDHGFARWVEFKDGIRWIVHAVVGLFS